MFISLCLSSVCVCVYLLYKRDYSAAIYIVAYKENRKAKQKEKREREKEEEKTTSPSPRALPSQLVSFFFLFFFFRFRIISIFDLFDSLTYFYCVFTLIFFSGFVFSLPSANVQHFRGIFSFYSFFSVWRNDGAQRLSECFFFPLRHLFLIEKKLIIEY